MVKEINLSNLTETTIIKKTLLTKWGKTQQSSVTQTSVAFQAKPMKKYLLLNKISGGISKEASAKVDNYYNKYKNSKLDAEKIKKVLVSQYDKLFEKLNYEENSTELTKLTPSLAKTIKDTTLKLLGINKLIAQQNGYDHMLSYKKWFNTNVDRQNPFAEFVLYRHPTDTIISLVGLFNNKDQKDILQLEKQFITENNKNLFDKKIKILTEINSVLKNKQVDFIGELSDKELNLLKQKAKYYFAMNNIHKKRGIYTKSIESVLFSENIPKDLSNNQIVNGIGLIKGTVKLRKSDSSYIDALLIVNSSKGNIEFSLYDKGFFDKKEQIQNEILQDYNDENINKINERAKNIIDNFNNNAKISRIMFRLIDKDAGITSQINKTGKLDYLDIKDILKNDTEFYYVHGFENMQPQKYINGGLVVAREMLNFIKDKRPAPLIIQALAFNRKKRSPFKLYYRYGFIPYSHSKEEIEKIMQNNNGEFPIDVAVNMYLRKDTLNQIF